MREVLTGKVQTSPFPKGCIHSSHSAPRSAPALPGEAQTGPAARAGLPEAPAAKFPPGAVEQGPRCSWEPQTPDTGTQGMPSTGNADSTAPGCGAGVPSLELGAITNANGHTGRSPACHPARLQSSRKTPLSSPCVRQGQEGSLIPCKPLPPPAPAQTIPARSFPPC